MSKTAKTSSRKPSRRRVRGGAFLGRTEDGLPDFKPESFSLEELDRAIRAAKRRQTAAQVG